MPNGQAPSIEARIGQLQQREQSFTDKLADRRAIFEEMNKRASEQFASTGPLTPEQLEAGQAVTNPLATLQASQQFQRAGLDYIQPAIQDVEQATQDLNDMIKFNQQTFIANKQLALEERKTNIAEQSAILDMVKAAQEAQGLGTAAQFNQHVLGTPLQALDVKDLMAVNEKLSPLVDIYSNTAELKSLIDGTHDLGKVSTGVTSFGAGTRARSPIGGLASKAERRFESLRAANHNNFLRLVSGAQVTPQEQERLEQQLIGWNKSGKQNLVDGDRTMTAFGGKIGAFGVSPEQAAAIVFAPMIQQPGQLQLTDQGVTADGFGPQAFADQGISGLDQQATSILDQYYPQGE